jgi:hypothetical protein
VLLLLLLLLLLLQDPSKRSPLQDEDAGRLLAGIRNALPVEYSGVLIWLSLFQFKCEWTA